MKRRLTFEVAGLALAIGLTLQIFEPVQAGASRVFLPRVEQRASPPRATPVPQLVVERLACLDEFVQVKNVAGVTINMEGWSVESARAGRGTQRFTFPTYFLRDGDSVFVDSGPNAAPSAGNHLRWTSRYIWNDDGDRADLQQPDGETVDREGCYQQ